MKQHGLTLLVLVAACGPDKGDGEGSNTESTGSETTAGGTTGPGDASSSSGGASEPTSTGTTATSGPEPTSSTGDDSTTGPVDPGDFGEMEKCMLTQVCESFVHQDGEAGTEHEGGGFDPIEQCILGGLRDGTPGRYVYGIRTAFSNGDTYEDYLIHVHADRSVTFAGHLRSSLSYGDADYQESESFVPAQTCTLVDPIVFADCLTEKNNFDHYECMNIEQWWTGCVAAGPRCE